MIAVPMEQFLTIPLMLNSAEISGRLRFDPTRAGFDNLDELIALAQGFIKPRAVYDVAYIGAKGEGTVEVAGVTLQSAVLSANLDGVNKVFPYIITVGPELERAAAAQGDLLKQYYLEEMANLRPRTGGRLAQQATGGALQFGSALQHESRLARGLAHHRADQALLDLRRYGAPRRRAADRQPAHGPAKIDLGYSLPVRGGLRRL